MSTSRSSLSAPGRVRPPHLHERLHNPYRAPKPENFLLKENYELLLSEDTSLIHSVTPSKIRLAALYLWFENGTSIPLSVIRDIRLSEKGNFVQIEYYDALQDTLFVLSLRPRKFLNMGLRNKSEEFILTLTAARNAAPSESEFLGTPPSRSKYVSYHCEHGDTDPPALLTLSTYFYLGIPIVAAVSQHKEQTYWLCERHAIRRALLANLYTGFLGYLGIPGVFIAPFRAAGNARRLHATFPTGPAWLGVLLAGFALPILLLLTFASLLLK